MAETIRILIDYFESKNIPIGTAEIISLINKYNSFYPDLDPFSLAAVCIDNSNKFDFTEEEIRNFKNLYFPSKFYNRNIFI